MRTFHRLAALCVSATVAYAPRQQVLGRWYRTGADATTGVYTDPGDKHDNRYIAGDGAFAIAGTPLTAKAHIGQREAAYLQPSFSKGQDGTGSIAEGAVVVSLTAAF